MKKTTILFILSIIIVFNLKQDKIICQQQCLSLVMENNHFSSSNNDSIMVDTCRFSLSYGQWYAKKGIVIQFYEYPFIEEPIPVNMTKYWYDIDTKYPLLREKLQYIFNKYGIFTISRENNDDYSHIKRNDFTLSFDNYICFDSLCNDIIDSSANILKLNFRYLPQKMYSVPPDLGMKPGTTINQLLPNMISTSFSQAIKSDYHKLGFQWNLHIMNLPMAWEISRGKRDIVLADNYTSDFDDYDHPDVINNFLPNFSLPGDSRYRGNVQRNSFEHIGSGHGLQTLSVAIADDDNGLENTMVGTAPNIMGIQTDDELGTPKPQCYDTDLTINNLIKMPDVFTNSGWGDGIRREIVANGIVFVNCTGNPRHKTNVELIENGITVVEEQELRKT